LKKGPFDSVETPRNDTRNLAGWCQSSKHWVSVPQTIKNKQIYSLASTATGEVIAGWEGGLGIWGTT